MSNIPSITIQAIPITYNNLSCDGCLFQVPDFRQSCSSNAQKMEELGLPCCCSDNKYFIYQLKKD